MAGTLYIVSTPIGNLEDITQRALRILREVDLIACEDTRHTRKLLKHFNIDTPTVSYHEHNERERAEELCQLLEEGKNLALVSDAGTPTISDPGYRLVKLAAARQIAVVPVPGVSAFVAALSAAGLPSDRILFCGFLPPRAGARREKLEELKPNAATLIFYEAPHRIAGTLRDALEILGDREVVLARELTKLHEEFVRGKLSTLAQDFATTARGEIVLIIHGASADEMVTTNSHEALVERVRAHEQEGLDARAALKRAARDLGLKRDEAYRIWESQKNRRSR